jgi:hypothetical protein
MDILYPPVLLDDDDIRRQRTAGQMMREGPA